MREVSGGDGGWASEWCILVLPVLRFEDRLPHEGESFVKAEFFPHLVSFLPSESPALDKSMYTAVRKAVLVPAVVESNLANRAHRQIPI